MQYWNLLRQERLYPTEAEVNPDMLADIWPYCFLVSLDGAFDTQHMRYSYLGEKLIEAHSEGQLNRNEAAQRLTSPESQELKEHFEEVARLGIPLIYDASFTSESKDDVRYRYCLVPLGDATTKTVTHVLGCMRWRSY